MYPPAPVDAPPIGSAVKPELDAPLVFMGYGAWDMVVGSGGG